MIDQHLQAAIDRNKGKAVIINQFFGLGDILFCEPIARKYLNDGYVVIWPVRDEFFWINEYFTEYHFRRISEWPMDYEQCNDDYTFEGIPVLPLRFSNPLLRGLAPHCGDDRNNWMHDKYARLNLPVETWKQLKWTRNEARENELYNKVMFEHMLPKQYAFVNRNFGGGFADANFTVDTKYEVVPMQKIEGFTMLDWAKVICEATEIHTVETSVLYMVEALPVKAERLHMYPRRPYDTNCNQIKNIITTEKWILHEEN